MQVTSAHGMKPAAQSDDGGTTVTDPGSGTTVWLIGHPVAKARPAEGGDGVWTHSWVSTISECGREQGAICPWPRQTGAEHPGVSR